MAAWLYEDNGRRLNRAIVVNIGNALMSTGGHGALLGSIALGAGIALGALALFKRFDHAPAPRRQVSGFGELLGLWAAAVWQSMGAPENVRLVELGPGRGTMMLDAMRAAVTRYAGASAPPRSIAGVAAP